LTVPDYRCYPILSGTYFFIVNFLERKRALLVRHIYVLRSAVRETQRWMPFHIDAWVVLPHHIHCFWTLAPGDADFSAR